MPLARAHAPARTLSVPRIFWGSPRVPSPDKTVTRALPAAICCDMAQLALAPD